MKRGGPNHPKTYALAEALGIRRAHAVGILEMLFHFAAQYAPEGDIGRYSDKRIAAAVDWGASVSRLIDSLAVTGWIDTHPGVGWVIHGWSEHADRSVVQRLTRVGKKPIQSNHKDTDEVTPQCATVENTTLHLPVPEPEPVPVPEPEPTNGVLLPPVELRPQTEYPETLRVIREHDASCDPFFVQRLADESARQIISDPVAQNWTMEKQRKAVSDPVLAKCCREVYATPRKKPPGTGLLLVTVPRILIGGKLNYV